jgi:hypothetical protein
MNKKQSCAPGVALLLCGICPGIQTAYWGGTISMAFSTSQVIRAEGQNQLPLR